MGISIQKTDSDDTLYDTIFENLSTEPIQQKVISNANLFDTVSHIQKMIRAGRKNPEIVKIARSLTGPTEGRDFDLIAKKVYRFLTERIKYHRDPTRVEWLQDPIVTLKMRSGDCDDFTVLGSSLLQALGVDTRIVIAQVRQPQWNHVYFEYLSPRIRKWIPFDASVKKEIGWQSENILQTKKYIV